MNLENTNYPLSKTAVMVSACGLKNETQYRIKYLKKEDAFCIEKLINYRSLFLQKKEKWVFVVREKNVSAFGTNDTYEGIFFKSLKNAQAYIVYLNKPNYTIYENSK